MKLRGLDFNLIYKYLKNICKLTDRDAYRIFWKLT